MAAGCCVEGELKMLISVWPSDRRDDHEAPRRPATAPMTCRTQSDAKERSDHALDGVSQQMVAQFGALPGLKQSETEFQKIPTDIWRERSRGGRRGGGRVDKHKEDFSVLFADAGSCSIRENGHALLPWGIGRKHIRGERDDILFVKKGSEI